MVKCTECGYLTFRHGESRTLVEAEEVTRQSGQVPTSQGVYLYEPRPICFRRAYPLALEFDEMLGGGWEPGSGLALNLLAEPLLAVLDKERQCNSFTSWTQGLAPREHYDMDLMEKQLALQDRRDEIERQWRVQQEDRQREWQGQETAAQRTWQTGESRRRFRGDVLIFGILVTLALVGGSVLAAFIERGSLFDSGSIQPVEVTNQQEPPAPPIINVPMPEFAPNIEIIIFPTPSVSDKEGLQPK